MDDIDQRLVCLLASNPRMHLKELGRELGISKQAVHRRMQTLASTGVIRGTVAGISFAYLHAIPVVVFGRSNTTSVGRTLDKLGESVFTRRTIVCGGNNIYVTGQLRSLSELDRYTEFVKRVAEMPDPTVGIFNLDDAPMPAYHVDGIRRRKQNHKELCPLDFDIIYSLKDDARRSVVEIAKTLGVSAKTVKRHIDDMVSDGSLELHTLADTPLGGDILCIMHVFLKDGTDKVEVGTRMLSDRPSLDAYVRVYVNLPCFLNLVFWTEDMRVIRDVFMETAEDRDVRMVSLNFGFLERVYTGTTWRDKLLEERVQTPRIVRPRETGPRKRA